MKTQLLPEPSATPPAPITGIDCFDHLANQGHGSQFTNMPTRFHSFRLWQHPHLSFSIRLLKLPMVTTGIMGNARFMETIHVFRIPQTSGNNFNPSSITKSTMSSQKGERSTILTQRFVSNGFDTINMF